MYYDDETCYYCGMSANAYDHVIPRSVLRMLDETDIEIPKNRIKRVPCCHECNCLLGASYQETIAERKKYLKLRLKNKYRALLKIPQWSEEEINELGYTLRQDLLCSLKKKEMLILRLKW